MKNLKAAFMLALVDSPASECAGVGPETSLFGGRRVTFASADQILTKEFIALYR